MDTGRLQEYGLSQIKLFHEVLSVVERERGSLEGYGSG